MPDVGPDKVKWIKITENPGTPNQWRVFFETTDGATSSFGYFVLNSATARDQAQYLVQKQYDQLVFYYTVTAGYDIDYSHRDILSGTTINHPQQAHKLASDLRDTPLPPAPPKN